MNRNDEIVATLRSLDAADQHVDVAGARARADLYAILGTDSAPRPGDRPRPTAARRSRRRATTIRRVVLVTGMVTAATAGVVLLPSVSGGDRAFATWTAAPEGLSAQEQAHAVADCRANYEDGPGARPQHADELRSADPVIAERRGVWTTIVLAGSDGFSAECITDDSALLFARGMIGSIGTPSDYEAPEPREVVARTLGVGTMNAGDISMISGAAGPDVVGVVYRSPAHGAVTATVNKGHFALWFPGDELMSAQTEGVEVEVTYRDGTTAINRLTY